MWHAEMLGGKPSIHTRRGGLRVYKSINRFRSALQLCARLTSPDVKYPVMLSMDASTEVVCPEACQRSPRVLISIKRVVKSQHCPNNEIALFTNMPQ